MIQLERNYKQWVGKRWKYPHLKAGHWRPNDARGMAALVACPCGSSYAIRAGVVSEAGIVHDLCHCGAGLELLNWNNPLPPRLPQWKSIKETVSEMGK